MIAIYGLREVNTDDVRYIGQTINKLHSRLRGHMNDKKKNYKTHWIKSVLNKGSEIEIFLIENVTEDDYQIREKYWIECYTNLGHKLTNGTMGGEFCIKGSKICEESKKIMSAKGKERVGEKNPMWGRKHNDDTKKLISEKAKGNYQGSNNPNAKKLYQYDINMNLIKIWEYAKECATFYNMSAGNISSFAKHNTEKNKNEPYKISGINNKKILLCNKDCEIIKEYNSYFEASIDTKIHPSTISRCCRNAKSKNDLYFKYKDVNVGFIFKFN